ncbi:replicative DNA helicase [Kribbella sp. NBC_01245]|uniref:replicative DNA helicase n=1 Tax=Kribbella sp. NBC_01245 TaxID=2903578 RepID=UPI003FA5B744
MSVAEFRGSPGGEERRPEMGFDRTPPQDIAAEQCVLGAMLLSKDAIADVSETIRDVDFYRPAHETIYDVITDLYARGEPADAITVSAELTKRGEMAKIGGAPYLHTLIASVPLAANAGYYAHIVREKAILRRLVEAGTKIVQIGYAGEGQVDEVVDQAQAEIYQVTERRTNEDYAPLKDIMESALDEIEAISARDGSMHGVPTGFTDLDELTNGLQPGQMIIVAARPAMGKALALDTPLATPTGWTTMGDVAVGDSLIGADGLPTRVVAATDVMTDRPCYQLTFSDGTTLTADANHQWIVDESGAGAVRTTNQLFQAMAADPGLTPSIPLSAPREVVGHGLSTGLPGEPDRRIEWIEPVVSVPVRCVEVDNADHLYLAGKSMIPTHNSTLGLDFARSCSIKNGLTSCIFSLEMSRTEITMRLLSAEAKVPLHHMRNGKMTDEDWAKLARKMGEVSEAPLFIDDSPNLTMMEIRAKARRLKQRHDLRMIIIDYMQLMTSGKKVESRQLEVSEFSRSIKLLAKELEVPVIAISQLNRGAEQRSDKRPMLSDLRESGCLTADTRLMRADTGAEISLGELLAADARDIPVWSLDDRLKLVPRTMTHVFPSGTKEVFRLKLASGREIKATANHPFLTYDGWKPLGDLTPGTRLGSLRHIPPPLDVTPWNDDEITTLITSIDLDSPTAALPESTPAIPKSQLGRILRGLWTRRGVMQYDEVVGADLSLEVASRRLAEDLARLLLRFNIFTRISSVPTRIGELRFELSVMGSGNQLRFCHEVLGADLAAGIADRLQTERTAELNTVPEAIWSRVQSTLTDASGGRLRQMTAVLDEADVEVMATNDIFWDAVVGVESLGEQEVYDATVMGTHNFVAEGIATHNSLEQDADMVILLHREDAYERESTRPGEADFIVAKHRNGPTADVVVAFQGHYSRFVDMAQNG